MVYANWKAELEAFEEDCDRLRQARRESLPVKVLGLAPLASLPLLGSVGVGRRLVAMAGMAVSGVSLLLEMDKHRSAYGGNLAVDLNASSDYDNLAGAFRSRSPRWEALCYLYSQLDPIHLKDRLGHLSDDEAGKALNRMIRQVQRGLSEIRSISSSKPGYDEIVLEIAEEWKQSVIKILDRCLFKAGVIDREDVEDLEDLEDVGPLSNNNSNDFELSSEMPSNGYGLTLFDWVSIQRNPDKFPHLMIAGETGSGKSYLSQRLLGLLGGKQMVINPHGRPSDFPGVKLIGGGRNYDAIGEALAALVDEMDSRYGLYAIGKEDFEPLNVIIDEWPSISATCKKAPEHLKLLLREARKVRIRLILLTQGTEVKALGVEGEGSIRDCLHFIRLGKFAVEHARKKGEAIASFINSQQYPVMVQDTPADSSVLAVLEPSSPYPTRDAEMVWDATIEDEEDDDSPSYPQLPAGVPLSTSVPLSDESVKLLGWLQRKANKHPNGIDLRTIQQAKPLGKDVPHTQTHLQPVMSELLGHSLIQMDSRTGLILLGR